MGPPSAPHGWAEQRRAREWRRLGELLPSLAGAAEAFAEARATLEPCHRDYVSRISTPKMAVSLDTAALLALLCRRLEPRRILDLGSGFSSFALRHPLAGCQGAARVSVDDDAQWLARSAAYLERHGLPRGSLLRWEDFRASPAEPFDLVFHDLGSMQRRLGALPLALDLTRERSGVIVLDDVHKRPYRRALRRALPAHLLHYRYLELRRVTHDDFGRYSALATALELRKPTDA